MNKYESVIIPYRCLQNTKVLYLKHTTGIYIKAEQIVPKFKYLPIIKLYSRIYNLQQSNK